MTLHVLHAGDGYTYLTRQVASGDVKRNAKDPLIAYYHSTGAPPGQWVGSGCADLDVSGEVSEAQMQALFGEGLHPDADNMIAAAVAAGTDIADAINAVRLGRRFVIYDKHIPLVRQLADAYTRFAQAHQRRPTIEERRTIKEQTAYSLLMTVDPQRNWTKSEIRAYITNVLGRARQPVAGFDCVFTPVKSVSVLWALGGHQVRQAVEAAHEAAWRDALAYGEKEGAFTRVGAGGVAQVETSGFVATAFTHRDSRAGDPNLHTHVAISNRVLAADGKWRTLDSRQMHRIAVSMSERYNARLEDIVTRQLGARWTERSKGPSKQPVREIAGIPEELILGFSQRRTQIEAGYEQLVTEYVRRHGYTPPRTVQLKLAQQACVEERPAKGRHYTLAEQVDRWLSRAGELLPGVEIGAMIRAVLGRAPSGPSANQVNVHQVAAKVVDAVSEHRSTWAVYHVRAEAERQVRGVQVASSDERDQLVEAIVTRALQAESIRLDVDLEDVPTLLQRSTGESLYRRRGADRYTSHALLDAEQRLLTDSQRRRGPAVPAASIDAAIARLERQERKATKTLNPGQRHLVHHFVGSGRALAVGIGPPGTGKSTAMRAVRAAWESTGGRVIGLAPSAAAASVLGDELGVPADTLHSLGVAWRSGHDVDVQAGDMLLVDEAGMAGTRMLDQVRALAEERGAVMRLVGDHRQLTAVEAGGALRLIHHETGGVELTEVRRFTDPTEAETLLKFRVGDPTAVRWYAAHGRLRGGVRAALLDQLYTDWHADQTAGRISIMVSDTNDTVRELSTRAQFARRAEGLAESRGVTLHDGTTAGVGDRIVTRLNRRRLPVLGARDYVKNGDLWEVEKRYRDGRLRVRHVRHGGRVTLPADYVADWVELGYAATIYRSQGLTVEISRAHLSPHTTRESAVVALSRGTDANYGYLETDQLFGLDEPETLPGDLFYRYRNHTAEEQALATILHRDGRERSATEELRDALDAPFRLDTAVAQYEHALQVYRGEQDAAAAARWVRDGIPQWANDILADKAWPALAAVLHQADGVGVDPRDLLAQQAARGELATAHSVAQVMHWRITELVELPVAPGGDRPEGLPGWVPTAPESGDPVPDAKHAELRDWLRTKAEVLAHRVRALADRVAEELPAWAASLGTVPEDPVQRTTWLRCAGQIAAYRERWGIPESDPTLLGPTEVRGPQAPARQWVERFLTAAGLTFHDPTIQRARGLQDRLAALSQRAAPASGPERPGNGTENQPETVHDVVEGPYNEERNIGHDLGPEP
ncbi:MobF family relaxase [Longimycelium tulufanense]|nr:MobF family relaxase [Longimycelium tulufanense]